MTARRGFWIVLSVALAPLAISLIVLVVTGGDYVPVSDHALTEMRVRDIGRHPVLTGLYSRDDWSHPGPAFFYLLVPLYRLAGDAPIAINIGALLVNAGAIAGMAVVARRLGGLPLALCTLVGCSLLVRTLGADFVSDPWNPSVTVLPFGLLVFLTWAMATRVLWSLPVAAATATFLAQTHVGFVVLALPLFGVGAAWLTVSQVRATGDDRARRDLATAWAAAAAVLLVLWLPVAIDLLAGTTDNIDRVVTWFRRAEDGTHTVAEGWRVISAQLAAAPEWLVDHREPLWVSGESAFLHVAPPPLLLPLVLASGWVLWRARVAGGASLVAVFGVTFVLGVVAVARTVGLVFDYRLRWTWIIGMVGLVIVLWAGWTVVVTRGPSLRAGAAALAVAGLVAASSVNAVVAADGETPREGDSEVLAAVLPALLAEVGGTDGQVVIENGGWDYAAWYTRSLVLELERRGIDARMLPTERILVGEHRVVDPAAVTHWVVVGMDGEIDRHDARPGLRRIASWSSVTDRQRREFEEEAARLERKVERGELHPLERLVILRDHALGTHHPAVAWALALYIDDCRAAQPAAVATCS